ncbi:MAG: flagellar assembly protein FliW [Acidimicrobiales bacterium]
MIDNDEIRFPVGLPGFPGAREFTLLTVEGTVIANLVPRDGGEPVFTVLLDPSAFFPALAPVELTGDEEGILGATSAEDLEAWVILGRRGTRITANLLGPVVVNRTNGRAVQAISSDPTAAVAALIEPSALAQPCSS